MSKVGSFGRDFGNRACPFPHSDEKHGTGFLILELNAVGASYVALDMNDGRTAWQLAGGDATCGSPLLTRVEDRDWVIFAGGGKIVGADAATGQQLWQHRTWGHAWMGPVVFSNLFFMANASLPRGCGVIQVDRLKPTVLWEAKGFPGLPGGTPVCPRQKSSLLHRSGSLRVRQEIS